MNPPDTLRSDGTFVVTGSTDQDVRIWNPATGAAEHVLSICDIWCYNYNSVIHIAASPEIRLRLEEGNLPAFSNDRRKVELAPHQPERGAPASGFPRGTCMMQIHRLDNAVGAPSDRDHRIVGITVAVPVDFIEPFLEREAP